MGGEGGVADADYAEACRTAEQLLADDLWVRGIVEYVEGQQRGQPAQGLQAFKTSLKADSQHADRQFFVATLCSMHGLGDEAEKGYEAAVAAAPERSDAYLELVMFLEARGRRDDARKAAARAIQAGAIWANEWQRPPIFIPGLTSRAWWDRGLFPWAKDLEAAYPMIKAEMDAMVSAKGKEEKKGKNMPNGWGKVGDGRSAHACDSDILSSGGDWRELLLFSCDRAPEDEKADADVARYLPKTVELLEKLVPGAVEMAKLGAGEIIFSALAPGTRLKPHCASSNVRLTCHLGMVVPDGTHMRVGDEWGTWQEGKCTFFDDSFEHEIVHEGKETRIVLLIRFWHPDLPQSQWIPTLEAGVAQNAAMERRRFTPPMTEAVGQKVAQRLPQLFGGGA